jgi:TRAP transporter TAXI family solute receptor
MLQVPHRMELFCLQTKCLGAFLTGLQVLWWGKSFPVYCFRLLRAVLTTLWITIYNSAMRSSALFVRKDSDIKTIGDLKGRAVVDGYGSQKVILPMLDAMYGTVGLNRNDMKGVQVANVGAGANAFAAGKTEMFFFGLGAAKVREVDASVKGIRMLSLPNTPEAVASIKKHFAPGHLRLEKPGPGNVGVLTPSYSLAYEAFAFGSTKTSDQTAYQVAKVMYENAKEMGVAFPAMRLFDPKTMASDVGLLKYHPGAIKFYKEVGIWPGK